MRLLILKASLLLPLLRSLPVKRRRRKVTGTAPFAVDFVVRASAAAGQQDCGDKPPPLTGAAAVAARPFVPSAAVSGWLATGSRSFSERFRGTFSLEDKSKGFEDRDVAAAKAALSNMLGGMGHFTGRSEVRGAGRNGGSSGFSFGASLFTAVPSRSFFPRGFLWDEGFHQVLYASFFLGGGVSWYVNGSCAGRLFSCASSTDFCSACGENLKDLVN